MNEEPTSLWKKTWKGPRGFFLWFILLVVAAFLVIFFVGLASRIASGYDLLLPAAVGSISLALMLVTGIPFIRWLCCWRNLRRFLFGVACFVTLIALLLAEENWRGKYLWKRYVREWEAKGEKFDVASLAPPRVPDEQNLALTPLLKPPLDFIRVNGRAEWQDTNGWNHLKSVSANLYPQRSKNDALTLGAVEKGTFADLEACRNFYRGNTNYPQPLMPGTAAQDILVALSKFDAEMKELREAAVSRPYSRFPIEYDYEMPAAILLPHLAEVKRLCILFQMRAIARLETGQSQEAFEDLKLGFRLSDSIREEPILVDHLVRISTLSIDLQVVREGLVRHAWNDAQLNELEKYLASIDLFAEYKRAMRGERALSIGSLEWMRRQGLKLNPDQFFGGEENGGSPAPPDTLKLMPGGLFYQNMVTIARLHQDFTLVSVDERTHRVFPDISENPKHALEKMRTTPYNIFVKLLFPALGKASARGARMQTYVDAARVACALERYRLAYGQWPARLDALTPQFLDKIPTDVIDGQPLRYRLTPGDYVVYSVGWNKTDDGGELAWTKGEKPTVDSRMGDWVWRCPAK